MRLTKKQSDLLNRRKLAILATSKSKKPLYSKGALIKVPDVRW